MRALIPQRQTIESRCRSPNNGVAWQLADQISEQQQDRGARLDVKKGGGDVG
jgi:hypothetical protein